MQARTNSPLRNRKCVFACKIFRKKLQYKRSFVRQKTRAVSPERCSMKGRSVTMAQNRKRVVIAALDGFVDWDKLVRTAASLVEGPIGEYLLAFKFNDAVDRWGADLFPKLYGELGITCGDITPMADMKIGAMADLKLRDVVKTNLARIAPYAEFDPSAIVTVAMDCGVQTWRAVPEKYPNLRTALMGVPTDVTPEECKARFGGDPWEVTDRQLAFICRENDPETGQPRAPMPPCIIAAADVIAPIREKYEGIETIVPGIRDWWMKEDHQKRKGGTYEVLDKGAWALVMGTQIIKGGQGVDTIESQKRTAGEIERFLADAMKRPLAFPPPSRRVTVPRHSDDVYLKVLHECNGYYEAPLGGDGKPLGKLVAYSGRYKAEGVKKELQYVGFAY